MHEKLFAIKKALTLYADHRFAPFGTFHLVWCAIAVIGMILAGYLTVKKPEKTLYTLFVVSTIITWIGEAYKQFVTTVTASGLNYDWYYFPFQFCSTPLYVYLVCCFLKKGKLYDCLALYSGTYCLFAGTMVMLLPTTVLGTGNGEYFSATQSLLHHVLMMITGVSALVYSAKRVTIKSFLGNIGVYLVLLAIAEVLNFGIPAWTGQQVNMYFIAKDYPTLNNPLGVFRDYYCSTIFGYPLLVVIYSLVFTEVSALIAFVAHKIASRSTRNA